VIKKKKIRVDFTFFATIALFFYLDKSGYGLMSIAACVIHETGHLLAIFAERKKLDSITFYGGGIKIRGTENLDASVLVLTAGSLMNIAVFAVLYFHFSLISTLQIFAIINLVVGIFNFLPLKHFDGGRLIEKMLIKIFPVEKALNTAQKSEIIATIFAVCIPVFLFVSGVFNPTLVMALIYVIAAEIIEKTK
jgi:Zn-dependent protease